MELTLLNYKTLCRICVSRKENMKNIFNFAETLMQCVPIEIRKGDGLPESICLKCEFLLNQAHKFRILCEKSDKFLRESLQDTQNEKLEEFYSDSEESVENQPLLLRKNSVTKKKRIISPRVVNKKINSEDEPLLNNEDFTIKQLSSSESSDSENESNKTGSELQCKYCDVKFRYKVPLRVHELKHIHGLKCHLCDKSFSTSKQLTNHINIHNRKGAHLCQTCGKQFTLPENLIRHQRIHNGIRPYKCQICNKSFTQSNELKSHIVTHTSEKNYLCNVCGNKYSRSISLRVHMRRIHSIPPNHRPFICSMCGRNFKDRRDLAQHKLIHTGERSHICKICGKAFNRSSNLRVHERIHSGHKPHVCPVCQRAFIQKHVLITHMRTHPYNVSVEVKMVVNDADNETAKN